MLDLQYSSSNKVRLLQVLTLLNILDLEMISLRTTPKRGGVTIQANEVLTQNGGRVIYTSTDQAGNFRIGDDLQINQNTGTISGSTFSRSLFSEVTPLHPNT